MNCGDHHTAYFMFNFFLFRKSCLLWDNVQKCGTVRQATDGNIIWCMRISCWINKATDKHTDYVVLIIFSIKKNSYANAPQRYVTVHCLSCNCIHTHNIELFSEDKSFDILTTNWILCYYIYIYIYIYIYVIIVCVKESICKLGLKVIQ